ncbi:MAG: hypothetical protein ACYTG1_03170 [Planctomycetota bacterium]|jgi:hypothetical protein
MATGILLVVVTAVSSAVVAGQQHAFEARQRIAGTLAAEELMGRLGTVDYADLPAWHGFTEMPGTMTDSTGLPYPESFDAVGRLVTVTASWAPITSFSFRVLGREVRVRSVDRGGRTLADITRFVPEPAS